MLNEKFNPGQVEESCDVEGQVTEQLRVLSGEVGVISSKMEELGGRLHLVLRSENTEEDGQKNPVPDFVPLARIINDENKRLYSIIHALQSILDRLEL